jgi:CRP-like cAMP-binding protein/glyoxylase-like metal-dependent hydrolase (beta-lactamase superfamily II)
MGAPDSPVRGEPALSIEPPASTVKGVWLTASSVQEPIQRLLLDLLTPNQPNAGLREALVEELGRPVKKLAVALEYLGLREVRSTAEGPPAYHLVVPKPGPGPEPWQEALVTPGGDCPLGFVLSTSDRGRVVVLHEVFGHLGQAERDLVRRYATMVLGGHPHEWIMGQLEREVKAFPAVLARARQQVQILDPSVLWSADGTIRVQFGSPAQTTRNILREGVGDEHLFVLPQRLVDGRMNYGDVEFVVYLNFFLRRGLRTRIAGTARQQSALTQLLTLTIHGVFDPGAREQASFEELHRRYGVPDLETYDFLRLAYESFAVRERSEPGAAVLPADAYFAYSVLSEEGETIVPIGGTEVRLGLSPGGCEARIVDPDGHVTAKHLTVSRVHRVAHLIPDMYRNAVRFATERPRFGITPLGTSHGFDPVGEVTSFVVWINGKGILVDPSPESLIHLERIGVAAVDVPYVLLTHLHADHDGGLLEKLLSGRRTTVIASDVVYRSLVEKMRLITGHDVAARGLLRHVPANPGQPTVIELVGDSVRIDTRWNLHPIPTNGFTLTVGERTFGYSGDTLYDPGRLAALRAEGRLSADQYETLMHFFWTADGIPTVDLLYHEAGIPPIHTELRHLQALPPAVRARTRVVHIADRDVSPADSPAKPVPFTTHVLLPSTDATQKRLLLETLRMVGYLYDTPMETLRELLDRANVLEWAPNDPIIEKGPVAAGEPLHFFVVADGVAAVRDGRRLVARLVKGDSFGEWGISHQRGFRAADVVATNPCQCIRLGEPEYWWLVDRQPAVQERISRLRRLIPSLQLAQDRARLRSDGVTEGPGRLEYLTTGQLTGFALFGETRTLRRRDVVVHEGDPADAFYVLLSGHLQAAVGGRIVRELAEGDGFGEIGLLQRGQRTATITVTSADAEVLVMGRHEFNTMLATMPAFAWGIWETATSREGAKLH